jgi:hypothetical protein
LANSERVPELLDDATVLRHLERIGEPDAEEAVGVRLVLADLDELVVLTLVGVDDDQAIEEDRASQRSRQLDATTLQGLEQHALSFRRVLETLGEDHQTAVALVEGAVEVDRTRVTFSELTELADVLGADPLADVEVERLNFRHVDDAVRTRVVVGETHVFDRVVGDLDRLLEAVEAHHRSLHQRLGVTDRGSSGAGQTQTSDDGLDHRVGVESGQRFDARDAGGVEVEQGVDTALGEDLDLDGLDALGESVVDQVFGVSGLFRDELNHVEQAQRVVVVAAVLQVRDRCSLAVERLDAGDQVGLAGARRPDQDHGLLVGLTTHGGGQHVGVDDGVDRAVDAVEVLEGVEGDERVVAVDATSANRGRVVLALLQHEAHQAGFGGLGFANDLALSSEPGLERELGRGVGFHDEFPQV